MTLADVTKNDSQFVRINTQQIWEKLVFQNTPLFLVQTIQTPVHSLRIMLVNKRKQFASFSSLIAPQTLAYNSVFQFSGT